ncbi:MAG TPA: formate dehydrogenase accessory sulfurtransferase FdhD [Planctomycetota bacterium]|nr:formate dehydrogenase accessory sulfurtransferase FdhD [Planctomycetota bacterium]
MLKPVRRFKIERRIGRRARRVSDCVAVEEPLEIRVGGEPVAVVMRTPGDDFALAAGFLCSEGVIRDADDLGVISYCPRGDDPERANTVDVRATRPIDLSTLRRNTYAASSCGICGKAAIETIRVRVSRVRSRVRFSAELLRTFPGAARPKQASFALTGGLHAAALFDESGSLVDLKEDVGRHNAVDKVVGSALLGDRLPLDRHALLVSGRASFEIVQKAAVAGIPIVCAISAPSSLAIETASSLGITLVGLLRGDRMNVYTGASRISAAGR